MSSSLSTDPAFIAGATTLLDAYLELTPSDRLLCVYDTRVEDTARGIAAVAATAARAITTACADEGEAAIVSRIDRHDVVLMLEANQSHFSEQVAARMPGTRAFRFFGARPDAVRTAFLRTPDFYRRLHPALMRRAHEHGTIRIESEAGTDLRIALDRKHGWISTWGAMGPNEPGIFPPAEVNTISDALEGVLVVDGAIQVSPEWPLDPRMADHPVTLRLQQGRVVDVTCRAKEVHELVELVLEATRNDRMHEIGIGTNVGLREFLSVDALANERFPAFHLGIGQDLDKSGVHVDFILGHCRVYFGPDLVLDRGQFLIGDEPGSHPEDGPRVISVTGAF